MRRPSAILTVKPLSSKNSSSGIGHLNGFGLFADPSSQRAHLAEAVRAATEALAVMDTVRWPTAEELRAAEEGKPLLQP